MSEKQSLMANRALYVTSIEKKLETSEEELNRLVSMMDTNRDGVIQKSEFFANFRKAISDT
jgi:Ca2+-binding EF-hand superfamily protein